MLIVAKTLHKVDQHLRISLLQLLGSHHITSAVTLTIDTIGKQSGEVATLVLLGILTILQHLLHHLLVGILVHLGMLQQILHQLKGGLHILTQTIEVDIGFIVTYTHVDITCQLIELLLQLRRTQLVSTQQVEVISSRTIAIVSTLSEVETVRELEEPVGVVLHIHQGQSLLGLGEGHILLEVHELRLDGLYLSILNGLHKSTLLVTVGLDRGDGRLVDLLLQRVNTLTLIHHSIAIGKELVGEVHKILLRDLRDTIEFAYFVFPVYLVDKGIHKHISAHLVVLQLLVVVTFLVIQNAGQQVVREVTLLQFVNLGKKQLLHLVKTLPLLGGTREQETTQVMTQQSS